jgi:hypothetical protein
MKVRTDRRAEGRKDRRTGRGGGGGGVIGEKKDTIHDGKG